jgi:tetratricopeptide (TPR) repeat protein
MILRASASAPGAAKALPLAIPRLQRLGRRSRSRALLLISGMLLLGCGGATQAPVTAADPPLDDAPAGPSAAEASSAQVKRGMELIQKKDFEGAKAALLQAQAAKPDDPQAAFYLGVALESLNDHEAAKKSYARALELDPKLTEASVNLSAILMDAGDAASALRVAEMGLRSAPRQPDLLMNRALALESAGNQDDAVRAYGAAVAAAPQNVELGYAYAELLAKTGRKDQALEQLHKLEITDDPKLIQAVANLFGRLKAFSECVAALDQAIKNKPTVDLYVRRGVCHHEMDEDDAARADYDAALKLDAESAAAHYYLGMHYREKGDKKQALTHLGAASARGKGTPVGEAADHALAELKSGKKK